MRAITSFSAKCGCVGLLINCRGTAGNMGVSNPGVFHKAEDSLAMSFKANAGGKALADNG